MPDREKAIHEAWNAVASFAMKSFRDLPVYRVRAPLFLPKFGPEDTMLQVDDPPVFEFQYQRSNPRPFEARVERVVCEGIVVYGPVPLR